MRWDNLFDDLEGQLELELGAEETDLQAEEERLRLGRLSIRDRVMSVHDAEARGSAYAIRIDLSNGDRLAVRPMAFGRDWFSADLLDESSRRSQCIVPFASICGLVLTREQVVASLRARPEDESERSLAARLGLPFVLRDLCRRRKSLEVRTPGAAFFGTIDRVGRDHLDLAVHEAGEARRESAVTQYRIVLMSHVALVKL
ncbi:MAG: hypothetical protein ABJB03_12100 [Rhodoglobus sp.]